MDIGPQRRVRDARLSFILRIRIGRT